MSKSPQSLNLNIEEWKESLYNELNGSMITVTEAKEHLFEFMENKFKDLESNYKIEITDISTEEDYHNKQIKLDINVTRGNK